MGDAQFGTALRELRQRQGVSLSRLAQLVSYSKGYLSKVETGQRPPTVALARSCDAALAADGRLARLLVGRPRRSGRPDPRPAQLPSSPAGFVGRAVQLARLDEIIAAADGAPVIAVLCGTPGAGKTALAVHWAHRISTRFPDGCLFADLRGHAPDCTRTEPEEVLDRFLRALGVAAEEIPGSLDGRGALLRTLLAGRRMLMVLDNAATSDQVRPLLPGSPGSLVVITSRSHLPGLMTREAAVRIRLTALAQDEAVTLLRQALEARRIDAEPAAAAKIAAQCGHLPLAIRIAADRTAARPWLTLTDLADQLAAERDRLDLLDTGDDESTAMRSVFFWSYRDLAADTARMFRLLSLHRGADISVPAAAALADIGAPQAQRLLDNMTGAHLLEETDAGRFRFHDLIRLYAAERAQAEEAAHDCAAATARLLTWYLHTANAADHVLTPQRRHLRLDPPEPACRPLALTSHEQALAWCDAEHGNLAAATRLADSSGEHAVAWQLPAALWSFFMLRKPWDEWISTCRVGLVNARRAGDRPGEAQILTSLGIALADLRQLDEAVDCFQQALDIAREVGDRRGEGTSLNNLGQTYSYGDRFGQALECHRRALPILQDVGDVRCEGITLENMGTAYRALGRLATAARHHERALTLRREIGDRYGEAATLHHLGDLCRDRGHLDDARRHYLGSLTLRREIGDRPGEAATLHCLGNLYASTGCSSDARQAWRQALTIYTGLGHPDAAVLNHQIGQITAETRDTAK